MSETSEHWDSIYGSHPSSSVSWYQREPTVSLRLITANSSKESSVLDVGAGTSQLVDRLMALDYEDVTLLDVSAAALSEVTGRLGECGGRITYVVGDVLRWSPGRVYDVWHDRAVFHFLTSPTDQARYVGVAAGALRTGAKLVIGVFANDGPTECSGLEVRGFQAYDLERLFGDFFAMEFDETELHVTPAGARQSFIWAVLRRRGN